MNRPAAPQEVADLTRGLDPDCADVIAIVSKSSANELRGFGFRGPDCEKKYDIAFYYGDREEAESLLGRRFSHDETRVLEGCIRHYLRTGATS